MVVQLIKGVVMSWQKITLSNKDVINGKISEIQHIFFDFIVSIYAEINTSQFVMLSGSSADDEYILSAATDHSVA